MLPVESAPSTDYFGIRAGFGPVNRIQDMPEDRHRATPAPKYSSLQMSRHTGSA